MPMNNDNPDGDQPNPYGALTREEYDLACELNAAAKAEQHAAFVTAHYGNGGAVGETGGVASFTHGFHAPTGGSQHT
jgi:hypothetical protein